MTFQRKKIIENYVHAYNHFDIEGMVQNMDENIIFENITDGKVDLRTEGLKQFVQQATAAKAYFECRNQQIETWDFLEATVKISISYKAILAIDLPNGMKAGDSLEMRGTSIFAFADGKIIRLTDKS
ncbi:nuclear transport factor 2 family protein [Cyclobacterium plantarum]|uniref:Nuclear transport factor 2 family protein n=1 Tax=Cyclobacterium plantarum TaxID=2716263 RepID=A0ABX0HA44_9BACT|nr:nuclear transport factor 2 family protein [Cyclobacterium plantarum]NHE57243.1 nuclear transport factor 2 family protein [Cyclobacterium plantarum]